MMRRWIVALLLISLCAAPTLAANKVYIAPETAVSWKVSGGDEALDLGDADGAAAGVALGSYHDWGAGSKAADYIWCIKVDGFDTDPVKGESVDIYVTVSPDATLWSGPEAPNDTTDGSGNVDRLKNLLLLGSVMVHSTTPGDDLVTCQRAYIPFRYWAPVVHNNTADKLLSTADAHEFRAIPVPSEVQ